MKEQCRKSKSSCNNEPYQYSNQEMSNWFNNELKRITLKLKNMNLCPLILNGKTLRWDHKKSIKNILSLAKNSSQNDNLLKLETMNEALMNHSQ